MIFNKKYLFKIIFLLLIFSIGILINILIHTNKSSSHQNLISYLQHKNLPKLDNTQNIKFNKKIIIINFWASWCSPCIKEIPLLNKVYHQYKDKVDLVGIAIDNKANVVNFNQHTAIQYPIFIGGIQAAEITKKMGNSLGLLPYTIVLDSKGNIIHKHIGELNLELLKVWLDS